MAGGLVNNGTHIFNRSDASTYSGMLSGSRAVTKQGSGPLTFAGDSTYSGLTTISWDARSAVVNEAAKGGEQVRWQNALTVRRSDPSVLPQAVSYERTGTHTDRCPAFPRAGGWAGPPTGSHPHLPAT